jgi:hypothetical protein
MRNFRNMDGPHHIEIMMMKASIQSVGLKWIVNVHDESTCLHWLWLTAQLTVATKGYIQYSKVQPFITSCFILGLLLFYHALFKPNIIGTKQCKTHFITQNITNYDVHFGPIHRIYNISIRPSTLSYSGNYSTTFSIVHVTHEKRIISFVLQRSNIPVSC